MAKNILIVDDEPNISLSLQFLMTQAGYEVRIAADGEVALQEVESSPPDLILLDVNMPKRSGFEVCETIRANAAWSNVRIVMLTAKGQVEDRVEGLESGADDYVTKPFSIKELLARVHAFLRRRETPSPEIYRFGTFRLDLGSHQLFENGAQAFERPGRNSKQDAAKDRRIEALEAKIQQKNRGATAARSRWT